VLLLGGGLGGLWLTDLCFVEVIGVSLEREWYDTQWKERQ